MAKKWQRLERIVKLKSRWITVYADKLLDHENNELEYWHFDRADSVIIIPVQHNHILLPEPIYRVGVGRVMLDFPGGRIENSKEIEDTVRRILQKELGVSPDTIRMLRKLNDKPYAVDSSFSSQKLYVFSADIGPANLARPPHLRIPENKIDSLFEKLECGQCRLALHEYKASLAATQKV